MKNTLNDFLSYKKMITPIIIQIVFWVLVIFGILYGIRQLVSNAGEPILGIGSIFILPLIARIACELLILFFRMNETLTEINNNIKRGEKWHTENFSLQEKV